MPCADVPACRSKREQALSRRLDTPSCFCRPWQLMSFPVSPFGTPAVIFEARCGVRCQPCGSFGTPLIVLACLIWYCCCWWCLQVYVPEMNWFLMVCTLIVVGIFQTGSDIGNAYGKHTWALCLPTRPRGNAGTWERRNLLCYTPDSLCLTSSFALHTLSAQAWRSSW